MTTKGSEEDGSVWRSVDERVASTAGARLLVAVSHRQDRYLLTEWLGNSYTVDAADPHAYPLATVIFEQSYDLVLIDGRVLSEHRRLMRLLREKGDDTFMPVLLVTSRETVNHATEDLWRLVDEVILKPIEKAELNARIEILLRARHYSLKLKERYYGLAELAPVGIIVIDHDGTVGYVNNHALSLFGNKASDLVGRSVDEAWDRVVPAGHPLPRDEWPYARILETGEAVHDQEIAFRNSAGTELRLSVSGVPIASVNGEIDSVLLVVNDVTSQVKQAEELRRARDRAEKMSHLKTAFLSNMSHEFRTPLTGILSSAEVISQETIGELHEIADLITVSAERLRRTLSAVLDLAQLESDTWRFSDAKSDVTAVVNRVVSENRWLAAEHEVEVIVDAPSTCSVPFDGDALERIVESLFSNAVKFTRKGRVQVRVDCSKDALELEIEDEGVGISADFLPHIFEEFKQESEGIARDFEGSGLGLTIANRLVMLLGGSVQVESTKGRGSNFRVTLPIRNGG